MRASSPVPAVDLCVSLGTTAQFLLLPQYDDLQMAVILPTTSFVSPSVGQSDNALRKGKYLFIQGQVALKT